MIPILRFLFIFLLVLNFLTLSLYWILPEAKKVTPSPVLAWSERVTHKPTTPMVRPKMRSKRVEEKVVVPEKIVVQKQTTKPLVLPEVQSLPDRPLIFTNDAFTFKDLAFETPEPVQPISQPKSEDEPSPTAKEPNQVQMVKQDQSSAIISHLTDLEPALDSDISEPKMDLITEIAKESSLKTSALMIMPPEPPPVQEIQEPVEEVVSQPKTKFVTEAEIKPSPASLPSTSVPVPQSLVLVSAPVSEPASPMVTPLQEIDEPKKGKEELSAEFLSGYAQVLHPIFTLKDQDSIYPDIWVRCKNKELRILIAKKLVENTSGTPLSQDHLEFWLHIPTSPPPKKYGEVSFQVGIGLGSEPWIKPFINPGIDLEITVKREDKGDFIALNLQGFQGAGLQWNLVFSKSSQQDGVWKQGHLFSTVKDFEWGRKEHLLDLDQDLTGPL
jgi:hypothetical protein